MPLIRHTRDRTGPLFSISTISVLIFEFFIMLRATFIPRAVLKVFRVNLMHQMLASSVEDDVPGDSMTLHHGTQVLECVELDLSDTLSRDADFVADLL